MLNHEDLDLWKNVAQKQWFDWRWQMRNKIRSLDQLASVLGIDMRSREVIEKQVLPRMGLEISPHMVLQIKRLQLQEDGQIHYADELLRTVMPDTDETEVVHLVELKTEGMGTGYKRAGYPGLPFLLRRLYNDRLLFCVTFQCPVMCRYCFRGKEVNQNQSALVSEIERGFQYIEKWNIDNPDDPIRDIIFSGGDPLSLSDERLENILSRARKIKGVGVLRIDTKFPTAIPQRVTPELAEILKRHHPLFITLHLVHPGEFSPESKKAFGMLADAGITLGTYTPLLKSINDNKDTLKDLFLKCIENRIRPYYLVHFIETEGAQHFKVSIERGLELLDNLHGYVSGIALPQYIVYLPKGGGKVIVSPNYFLKRTRSGYWFRNWQDEACFYPDPVK